MAVATFEVRHRGLLERRFYVLMVALTALVVVTGFSRTVNAGLIHPHFIVPPILYVHTALYVSWIAFLFVQTGLVQTRRVALHRTLGMGSLAFGAAMSVVGVLTALAMARVDRQLGSMVATHLILTPFFDMLYFTVLFWLGIWYRKRPEFHRRFMLLATIVLTSAAFSRFPHFLVPQGWYYCAVDAMILLCVARDLVVQARVHRVYLTVFPILIAGQIITMTTSYAHWWDALSEKIFQ